MKIINICLLVLILLTGCTSEHPPQKLKVDSQYVLTPEGIVLQLKNNELNPLAINETHGPFSDLFVERDELEITYVAVQQASTGTWMPIPAYSDFARYAQPTAMPADEVRYGFTIPEQYSEYAVSGAFFWISNEQYQTNELGHNCVSGTVEAILLHAESYQNPDAKQQIEIPVCQLDLSACRNDDEKVRMLFEECPGTVFQHVDTSSAFLPLTNGYHWFVKKEPFDFAHTNQNYEPKPQPEPFTVNENGTVSTTLEDRFPDVASLQNITQVAYNEKWEYYGDTLLALDSDGHVHVQFATDARIRHLDATRIMQAEKIRDMAFFQYHIPIFLTEDGELIHFDTESTTVILPEIQCTDIAVDDVWNLYLTDTDGKIHVYSYQTDPARPQPFYDYAKVHTTYSFVLLDQYK